MGPRVALWRIVRLRWQPAHGGNPAGVSREFVAFIWRWERNHRGFEERVRRDAGDAPVIRVRSSADVAGLLARVAR